MRKIILMAVYNPIEYDGRVKRTAETLSKKYKLIILSPKNNNISQIFFNENIEIRNSYLKWKKWPTSFALPIFWLQLIIQALKIRPMVIYAHDFYLSFPGYFISKIIRCYSIYDAHELIIPDGQRSMSNIEKFYYCLERAVINQYDLVIAANEERSVLMKDHYKLKNNPTSIRNISKSTLHTISKTELLSYFPQLYKNTNEKFLVYMGDISLARGLLQVIDSLSYLSNNIILILIGNGPDRELILNDINTDQTKHNRIRILGEVPQHWIQDITAFCDIGILTYSLEGYNNYYCSPNKIFEYAQAGLPIVSTTQPTLVNTILKYKIGAVAGTLGNSSKSIDFAIAVEFVIKNYEEMVANLENFLNDNSYICEQNKLLKKINEVLRIE